MEERINTEEIKYPIGVQSFETIIREGYKYVDKTQYIKNLVNGGHIYFLGRPRRFGKSLLLSTLQAFFEGKRELFKGLAIDRWDDWDWDEYPVIRIDLNAKDYTKKESVFEKLHTQLEDYEVRYGINERDLSPAGKFQAIIKNAYEKSGKKVVVLIDEYDKPILETIHDDKLKEMHRDTLRAFYSVLKSNDEYLKFCFMTGVTKFGQLSIFSGLNNLQDISMYDEYAGVCGITEEELKTNFQEGVARCAAEWECTIEEAFRELKENYDGYHFSPCLLDVYNPWSVLNALARRFIDPYWNASGGSMSFVYKLLQTSRINLTDFTDLECTSAELQGTDIDIHDAIPVLYQSGYLTIKSYDRKSRLYTMKYPNREVATGFLDGLLPAYTGATEREATFAIRKFVADVKSGNVDAFLERMQDLFADFPYENALKTEKDFHNVMYCVMAMMGLQVKVEQHSCKGSADMVLQTQDYIYIFEFKVNKSPEEALAQIETRGYATPFAHDLRTLVKVGVEFSIAERNITRWKQA